MQTMAGAPQLMKGAGRAADVPALQLLQAAACAGSSGRSSATG